MTTVSLSTRVPSVGLWLKTTPSSTSELDTGRTWGVRPFSSILLTAFACWRPDDVGDGHGSRLGLPLNES